MPCHSLGGLYNEHTFWVDTIEQNFFSQEAQDYIYCVTVSVLTLGVY